MAKNKQEVTGGMKCPRFEGNVEGYQEWRELLIDWMEIEGKKLEYPCLVIRLSLKGRALEVAMRIERDTLMKKEGFKVLLDRLDLFFKKDRNTEKLEKATRYFTAERRKDERVIDFLRRQEELRSEWRRVEGEREEMEGLMLIHQANINDNDYHVILGRCGDDRSYDNVWRNMKSIFGGRLYEDSEKEKKTQSWKADEGRKNPIGKSGKRLKCMNCLSEFHFLKDCKEELKCYICKKKEHIGKDCPDNKYKTNKDYKKEETNNKTQNYFCQEKKTRRNIEEGILDPGCPETVVGHK